VRDFGRQRMDELLKSTIDSTGGSFYELFVTSTRRVDSSIVIAC